MIGIRHGIVRRWSQREPRRKCERVIDWRTGDRWNYYAVRCGKRLGRIRWVLSGICRRHQDIAREG